MKFKSLTAVSLASVLVLGSAIIPAQASPSLQLVAQATAPNSFVTVEQDHPTTGTARIVTENGQRYLEFDRQFDTARGPDVKVILYRGSTVPVNVSESDYITLAALKGFSGAQRYAIPNSVNLDDFQAVGIWCKKFNVTFGYASL
ncbi:DM13 domain-containing protein [Lusitaniella coriacea LEGE 07157]|uniref:DM13 domain-containing protein n=1 Tax=Lusitaniella coriacea LEGE 07157 TaxID=945747 RepID=A0A8J7DXB3_9CYAN|nr:DM13 domain-containing protein [Lusitaniella coriacea]MBE9116976.1 DM13 domain-containing protein [Lusitaniella coriacea LEGE 07157]